MTSPEDQHRRFSQCCLDLVREEFAAPLPLAIKVHAIELDGSDFPDTALVVRASVGDGPAETLDWPLFQIRWMPAGQEVTPDMVATCIIAGVYERIAC
jgi:hypothetical protein